MQFSEISGLAHLKQQLTAAYQKGMVAHAQLFSGQAGTSTLPMALAYATYLMCPSKTATDSCGKCPNCLRMKKLIHPDVHFFFPKSSANESKYDKVLAEALPRFRSFVAENPYGDLNTWAHFYGQENKNLLISREDSRAILRNVSMRSVEGGYKILIIWCPEKMNVSAANAILKVLEEPPQKTIYLLVSSHYEQLLTTITSRTQLVVVPPNTTDEIAAILSEKNIPQEKAEQIASLSEGKILKALQQLEEESTHEYEDFQQWMRACWTYDFKRLVTSCEEYAKSGKTNQQAALSFAMNIVRKSIKEVAQVKSSASNEELQFIEKFSKSLGFNKLEKLYTLFNEAAYHLERNANPRITHLNLSLRISQLLTSK